MIEASESCVEAGVVDNAVGEGLAHLTPNVPLHSPLIPVHLINSFNAVGVQADCYTVPQSVNVPETTQEYPPIFERFCVLIVSPQSRTGHLCNCLFA